MPETIPERFAAAAQRFADRTAVVDRDEQIGYAELARRVAAAASALGTLAPVAGKPVALALDPGVGFVTAVLATLASGAVCVPLDPRYPRERLRRLAGHSRAVLFVTEGPHEEIAASIAGEAPLFRIDATGSRDRSGAVRIDPDALASIVYTSGSTGHPKGVCQTHRNFLHHVDNYAQGLRVTAEDRFSWMYSPAFAASFLDLFAALLHGASLHPYVLQERGLGEVGRWLEIEGITVLHAVPSVFRRVAAALGPEDRLARIRVIDLAGEPVTRRDAELFWRHFRAGCRLVNHLAFTEASVIAQHSIDHASPLGVGMIPVGRAAPGIEILLLDDAGRPVADGETGEIVVRSRFLSPGYWQAPELTARAFGGEGGDRLYRSGDLGRRDASGVLVHLGRKDSRVKVRGVSVELTEVEAALAEDPDVGEGAAAARPDRNGELRLVAWVVPRKGGAPPEGSVLRRRLASRLPAAMIPTQIVVLDELPTSPNGKVDRRALPDASPAVVETESAGSLEEAAVAAIWEEVLGRSPIGLREDFIDAGGDSLRALELVLRLERRFGRRLPLGLLAEAPTIAAQASRLADRAWAPSWPLVVTLRRRGREPALFCVPGAGSDVVSLIELARHAGDDRPFHGLGYPGLGGGEPVPRRLDRTVKRMIEAVRGVQPAGPYLLCGSSHGGIVALELARELTRLGERIAFLGLIDSYGPGYPRLRLAAPPRYRIFHWLGEPRPPDPRDGARDIARRLRSIWSERLAYRASRLRRRLPEPALLFAHARHVAFAQKRRYRPVPYGGAVHLFRLSEQPSTRFYEADPRLGWDGFFPQMEIVEVPGVHGRQLGDPWVGALGRALREAIDRATGDGARGRFTECSESKRREPNGS